MNAMQRDTAKAIFRNEDSSGSGVVPLDIVSSVFKQISNSALSEDSIVILCKVAGVIAPNGRDLRYDAFVDFLMGGSPRQSFAKSVDNAENHDKSVVFAQEQQDPAREEMHSKAHVIVECPSEDASEPEPEETSAEVKVTEPCMPESTDMSTSYGVSSDIDGCFESEGPSMLQMCPDSHILEKAVATNSDCDCKECFGRIREDTIFWICEACIPVWWVCDSCIRSQGCALGLPDSATTQKERKSYFKGDHPLKESIEPEPEETNALTTTAGPEMPEPILARATSHGFSSETDGDFESEEPSSFRRKTCPNGHVLERDVATNSDCACKECFGRIREDSAFSICEACIPVWWVCDRCTRSEGKASLIDINVPSSPKVGDLAQFAYPAPNADADCTKPEKETEWTRTSMQQSERSSCAAGPGAQNV